MDVRIVILVVQPVILIISYFEMGLLGMAFIEESSTT